MACVFSCESFSSLAVMMSRNLHGFRTIQKGAVSRQEGAESREEIGPLEEGGRNPRARKHEPCKKATIPLCPNLFLVIRSCQRPHLSPPMEHAKDLFPHKKGTKRIATVDSFFSHQSKVRNGLSIIERMYSLVHAATAGLLASFVSWSTLHCPGSLNTCYSSSLPRHDAKSHV